MIVRILTEGQYEVDEATLEHLQVLDHELVDAVEAGDEAAYRDAFERLLGAVREGGRALEDDHLGGSDLMLPPPDTTLAEARDGFTGEGLIPD